MRDLRPALLACLAACAGDAPPGDDDDRSHTDAVHTDLPDDPCLAEPATLRLGTGERAFVPLADGDDLALVHGPQGGWHFDVSLLIENVPQRVVLEMRALDATGAPFGVEDPARRSVALPAQGGGFAWACDGEWIGDRVIVDFQALGAPPGDPTPWTVVVGEEVTLEAVVRLPGVSHVEPGPVLASDRVTVVARPDPCDADPDAEGCGF